MQVLRSRRGLVVTVAALVLALAAAGGAAAHALLDRPAMTGPAPAPGSAVATDRPVIGFAPGAPVRDVRVFLDGEERTGDLAGEGGRVLLRTDGLEEGTHTVEVRMRAAGPVPVESRRSWEFEVRTTPPELEISAPGHGDAFARSAVAFTGTSAPGARVEVAHGDAVASGTAGADGAWRVVARLPDGELTASVTAVDRAGNATRAERTLVVDTVAPELVAQHPGDGGPVTETDRPMIHGEVRGEPDLARVTFGVDVNGRKARSVRGAAGMTPEGAVAAGGESAPLQLEDGRFSIDPGTLPQGRNQIVVWVRDAVGNTARHRMVVLVNSTESFGAARMLPGARGADAARLQRRLAGAGVYDGPITGRLDAGTEEAIARYQARFDLPPTGWLDEATRRAMLGRIVVTLGEHRLRLIRDGEVAREYRVAIGKPSHPTPLGTFQIISLQEDPTWLPPDSPWAEGLGPIPPGPGNPLGTRWIGTSSPAIGIHGTYAGSSIGTAASHGCIRMHIPDVEELYEEVAMGMEVTFRP